LMGDQAPKGKITTYRVSCDQGHKYLSLCDFKYKIPVDACGFCKISTKATIHTESTQLLTLARSNLEVVSSFLRIPPAELQKMLDAKNGSAFHAVHRLDGAVDPMFFDKWSIFPEDNKKTMTYKGCRVINNSDIYDKISNNMDVLCPICYTTKPLTKFKSVCSNSRCNVQLCIDCLSHTYDVSETHRGQIQTNVIKCCFCRCMVKSVKEFNPTIWRQLKRAKLKQTLYKGEKVIARCDEKECGKLFSQNKNACGVAEDEVVYNCSSCVETKQRLSKVLDLDLKMLSNADRYGFINLDRLSMRFLCVFVHIVII